MKPLSLSLKREINDLLMQGLSTRQIQRKLHVSQSSVQRQRKTGKNDLPESKGGRPKKLSPQDLRCIIRCLATGEAKSASHAAALLKRNTGKVVSKWTIQRGLRSVKFRAIEKKKKPLLSKKNIKARLAFVKRYQLWTEEDWMKVIWSDETKINRYTTDGRQWNWKREGEGMSPKDFILTVKHGGGNIKMWGCFTAYGVGSIRKIDGIMNKEVYLDILNNELLDTLDNMPYRIEDVTFQQDNDPKHTAKVVKSWLAGQSFKLLEWPAQSPDLNPIENLWSYLKRCLLNNYERPPSSLHELWVRVHEQWEMLSPDYLEKLVRSMPRRLAAVKKAKGLWTKY